MNKYRAKGHWFEGQYFASKKELRRYAELRLLLKGGAISNLECQPKYFLNINGRPILIKSKGYPNGRRASYKPDFRYIDRNGSVILEDTKSLATRTEAYALRKAVFEACYPDLKVIEI